jgi:hypothetical protein
VSEIQTDFPPGKDEPASIADASPARSYAARIVNSWRHAADGMMEVARLCCEASQLLTASGKKQLIKRLPFKESTFSKFVQIGKDARLQSLHARRLLPPHYTIAYPLTRLTDDQLETAAKQGVINPDMKRADLQRWLNSRKVPMEKAPRANRSPAKASMHDLSEMPDQPPFLDRRGAEVVAAQNDRMFAALEAAWTAAPDLRAAWASATDAARERFVSEVLRMSPASPSRHANTNR